MNSKEAKDFLVQATSKQAEIQGIPLSELERRMMYFTEWDDSCENPIQLNEEFEEKYDTTEYEPKMAGLLKNAYKRIKHENPEAKRTWDEAVKKLSEEDHYIIMLWNASPKNEHRVRDFLLYVGIGIVVLYLIIAVTMFKAGIDNR